MKFKPTDEQKNELKNHSLHVLGEQITAFFDCYRRFIASVKNSSDAKFVKRVTDWGIRLHRTVDVFNKSFIAWKNIQNTHYRGHAFPLLNPNLVSVH
jgi:hypothetical protein